MTAKLKRFREYTPQEKEAWNRYLSKQGEIEIELDDDDAWTEFALSNSFEDDFLPPSEDED